MDYSRAIELDSTNADYYQSRSASYRAIENYTRALEGSSQAINLDTDGTIYYQLRGEIYRTQENWFLSLDPLVRQHASDELLVLLGYKAEGLGLVYGASPA